jgi:hypothetical protein
VVTARPVPQTFRNRLRVSTIRFLDGRFEIESKYPSRAACNFRVIQTHTAATRSSGSTNPYHPLCGEAMLITRQYGYRGTDLVVIPQPDGSVACIPAWMTHESAARHKVCIERHLSLDVLRALHAEADALLRFLRSDSGMEDGGAKHEAQRSESTARSVRGGPQDRDGRFSTELFERCQRSEQALVATLAEMYVQGVSIRKVKAITEEVCAMPSWPPPSPPSTRPRREPQGLCRAPPRRALSLPHPRRSL